MFTANVKRRVVLSGWSKAVTRFLSRNAWHVLYLAALLLVLACAWRDVLAMERAERVRRRVMGA